MITNLSRQGGLIGMLEEQPSCGHLGYFWSRPFAPVSAASPLKFTSRARARMCRSGRGLALLNHC
jgi:hypothetical protein